MLFLLHDADCILHDFLNGPYTAFCPENLFMATSSYQPITKEKAAEILSVSKRTINYWLADGTLPSPVSIGRRVYWHPENFYRWLDEKLGGDTSPPDLPNTEARRRGRPRAKWVAPALLH